MSKFLLCFVLATLLLGAIRGDQDEDSKTYCPPIAKLKCKDSCLCTASPDSAGKCPTGFQFNSAWGECTVSMALP
uniref:Putative conserved secreted protein n=1 Tax=Culex tarsalis TaxID=7177 RepID=A0A1Q3EUH9_CULTA